MSAGSDRVVADVARQRRWDRHHHSAGGNGQVRTRDLDAILELGHGLHRGAKPDGVTQACRYALGDDLGAPDDLVLLVAALDRHEPDQAAAGADEEEQVEQRHLGQVAGEEGPHRGLDQLPAPAGGDVARGQPPGHRLRIPRRGPPRVPGGVDRDLPGHGVQPGDALPGAEQGQGTDARRLAALIAMQPPTVGQQAVPATLVAWVVTPISLARAKMRSWWGPTNVPPMSRAEPPSLH